jgi:hypothetical protein
MANYPKNPVSNFPFGQKISASWQNRSSPFDDNPVSQTGFGLQDHTTLIDGSAEQAQVGTALDDNSGDASESASMPDAGQGSSGQIIG